MSFSEKILNKSDTYNFYKNEYERLLKENKKKNEIIQSKKNIIEGKNRFINQKKEEFDEKVETIKEQNETIRNNNKTISELNGEVKRLKKKISQDEEHISYLENEIKDYSDLCKSISTAIYDQNIDFTKEYADLKDIKIAYILNSFPEHSQTFIHNELRWLVENNFNVTVFHKRDPYKSIEPDFDIESHKFSSKKQLAKLLIDYKIEFVHAHFMNHTCREFTYPVCEFLDIPFTVFAHAFDIFSDEYHEKDTISKMTNSDLCLGIYTLSDFHKNYLISQNANPDKIILTKQATDYELCEFSQKETKIKNIIAVSRFVEKKGLDVLIDAAKLLEDEDLIFEIYGFGILEEELQEQIERLDCKNISIKGELSPSDVKVKLKEADLTVVPCKVAENGDMDGIPTVIFESMAVGLLVLTTSISAIPEIIKDGENGFIIEPENPELLAEKIKEIISMPSEELYEIRCKAQEDVKDISSVDKTMECYLDNLKNHFKIK